MRTTRRRSFGIVVAASVGLGACAALLTGCPEPETPVRTRGIDSTDPPPPPPPPPDPIIGRQNQMGTPMSLPDGGVRSDAGSGVHS
jgi:hypothetical protein